MDKNEVNVACANQKLELRTSYELEVSKDEVPHGQNRSSLQLVSRITDIFL